MTQISNTESGSSVRTKLNASLYKTDLMDVQGTNITAATTTDIGASTGESVNVTGNTTITGLGTVAAGVLRWVKFTGTPLLTYNATSLKLPSSANIQCENNDVALFRSLGSGNWECLVFLRNSGKVLIAEWNGASASVASDTTTDLSAVTTNYINITGTTTITGFGTVASGKVFIVKFAGALTLTYNVTTLILPTAASITTAAGDTMVMVSEGSGNWRVVSYQRASGAPLVSSGLSSVLEVITFAPSGTLTNYDFSTASAVPSTSKNVTTIIRFSPTVSHTIQSFNTTGWEDGKRIIIENGTLPNNANARMMLVEKNNGASGTKFTYMAHGMPAIILPSNKTVWRYNATTGLIELESASSGNVNPTTFYNYWTDFFNTAVITNGELVFGSAGTSSLAVNTTFNLVGNVKPLGVVGISTSSASAVGSLLVHSGNMLKGGYGCAVGVVRCGIDTTLSTGSDTWVDYVGFHDGNGAAVSDGIGWKYDAATSSAWITSTTQSGTETATPGQGPTADTTSMPYFGVFANGDWTRVEHFFSTDGLTYTFCATAHTTNIPTSTVRLFSFGAIRRRTAGTSARVLAIDCMAFRYSFDRGN